MGLESRVLRVLVDHPRVFLAATLASYAEMTLQEFSDTYRRLVTSGHLGKGGPIHGLLRPAKAKPRPVQETLFEIERNHGKRRLKSRPDLGFMIPEEK